MKSCEVNVPFFPPLTRSELPNTHQGNKGACSPELLFFGWGEWGCAAPLGTILGPGASWDRGPQPLHVRVLRVKTAVLRKEESVSSLRKQYEVSGGFSLPRLPQPSGCGSALGCRKLLLSPPLPSPVSVAGGRAES